MPEARGAARIRVRVFESTSISDIARGESLVDVSAVSCTTSLLPPSASATGCDPRPVGSTGSVLGTGVSPPSPTNDRRS